MAERVAVRYGIYLATLDDWANPRSVVKLAKAAEAAGWHGFFVYDHRFLNQHPTLDPWVTLGAVAEATQRMHIGPMVVPLPRYEPWQVAHHALALQELSDGRLILGIGLGLAEEYRPIGQVPMTPSERPNMRRQGETLKWGLSVLRRLLDGESISDEFRWDDPDTGIIARLVAEGVALLRPHHATKRVPIWVAGNMGTRRP